MNSLLLTDGYKTSHHQQYPEDTALVYSNFTPRSNKYGPKDCNEVVVFGTSMAMQVLHNHFKENFFDLPKQQVIGEIKRELDMYLNTDYDVKHFEDLHDLGYLPIHVKALEEGTFCPIRVPMLTIYNTKPEFYWVTNFLESILSNLLWKPMTSATIAYKYKQVLTKWAKKTDENNVGFVNWQGHDFSFRGLDSEHAVIASGLGHLTSFLGTDSLPAVFGARKYYNEKGFVAGSVPATEHSVMCAGSKENELETFRRLLRIYADAPVLSVVSDTWDLWNVVGPGGICEQLKEEILARPGKLVIRPDSGDPVDILCGLQIKKYYSIEEAKEDFEEILNDSQIHGEQEFTCETNIVVQVNDKYYNLEENVGWNRYDKQYYFIEEHKTTIKEIPFKAEYKGVIELLWDTFGGTVNEQGYKVLDSHIGAIYGDSITIERAEEICKRLEAKGFASTNVVLGIGSFTYQYNTRDTFGFAMKATYVEKTEDGFMGNGPCTITTGYPIFKDPVTDDGTKKSAVGLLKVYSETGQLILEDNCSWEEENKGLLKTLYLDGKLYTDITLTEIREKLNKYV